MLAPIQLDPHSDEPLYRQLYAAVRREIREGRLEIGARIPPTRELAGLLGLNRNTVAAAYELLEQEGLIRGHVGRGSFVAGAPATETAAGPIQWSERFVSAAQADAPAAAGVEISFTAARPAEELFPLEDFRQSCAEVIAGPEAAGILQLGSPHGYGPLREYLLRGAGENEGLLITSGCQQALDLLQRLFAAPGDTVLLEDPVYPGLKSVFAGSGVRTVGVPVTADGLDLDWLQRLIVRERPRLLVVTPNFQNPTGATMPLAARQALLRLGREHGLVLVENDIYGGLLYEGEPLPSLKDLEGGAQVVQLRSFSKLAFPGLRVGWVRGPRAVVQRLAELKQQTDLHSDQLSQAVLLRFAESGRLERHRARMIEAGRERLRAVLSACERHLPEGTRLFRPRGGMNLWVRLPEPLDSAELLPQAQAAGVSYLPGRYFAVSRPEPNGLRLSFAGLRPEQIESGLTVLGRIFGDELRRSRAARPALAPAIV